MSCVSDCQGMWYVRLLRYAIKVCHMWLWRHVICESWSDYQEIIGKKIEKKEKKIILFFLLFLDSHSRTHMWVLEWLSRNIRKKKEKNMWVLGWLSRNIEKKMIEKKEKKEFFYYYFLIVSPELTCESWSDYQEISCVCDYYTLIVLHITFLNSHI